MRAVGRSRSARRRRRPLPYNRATMPTITTPPPLFGNHRKLDLPVEITADDGTALRLYHPPGGPRGAVLLAPGTAMTGLSFCLDTVRRNLAEYLHAEGFTPGRR